MIDTANLMGQLGESAVAAQLAAAGFHVYVPVFAKPEADLIAEYDGQLIRIQVKTAAGVSPTLRFCAYTSSAADYVDTVDWLAFHSPHYGVTAFLKPAEVGVRPTLWFDDSSDPGHESKTARYASDYPLERVIKEITT